MKYEIAKGSARFICGFDTAERLLAWLEKNPRMVGFAFAGRSNVGKSSLINSLMGKDTARVSKTPGRTREINIFAFDLLKQGRKVTNLPPLYLFDLPGYGFAEVSQEMALRWQELMDCFFKSVSQNVLIVNVQDSRHPAQDSDLLFKKYFKETDLEGILVFNKIDKLKTQKERAQLEKIKPLLSKEFKNIRQMYFVSAEKKNGLDRLQDSLVDFLITKSEAMKAFPSDEAE